MSLRGCVTLSLTLVAICVCCGLSLRYTCDGGRFIWRSNHWWIHCGGSHIEWLGAFKGVPSPLSSLLLLFSSSSPSPLPLLLQNSHCLLFSSLLFCRMSCCRRSCDGQVKGITVGTMNWDAGIGMQAGISALRFNCTVSLYPESVATLNSFAAYRNSSAAW